MCSLILEDYLEDLYQYSNHVSLNLYTSCINPPYTNDIIVFSYYKGAHPPTYQSIGIPTFSNGDSNETIIFVIESDNYNVGNGCYSVSSKQSMTSKPSDIDGLFNYFKIRVLSGH